MRLRRRGVGKGGRGRAARRGFHPAGARGRRGAGDPRPVAPEPAPAWVTAVPSSAGGFPVAAFARALAAKLGLPYVE